jgi:uncharacterized membrane protein YhhN
MDLKKNTPVNVVAYAAASTGAIMGQLRGSHTLEYVCTPLMMLILSSWFFFNSRRMGDRFTLLIQAGLFFSLVGDVALMFQHLDEFNFLIGLAAFLIAHLCYAFAFAFNVFDVGGTEGAWLSALLGAGVLVMGTSFVLDILGSANVEGALVLPVIAYACAITLMGIFAALRFRKTFDRSFWMVFVGTMLLLVSDMLLADRKFNLRSLEVGPLWIMVPYAIAQLLIAGGCLLHVLDPDTMRKKQALEA